MKRSEFVIIIIAAWLMVFIILTSCAPNMARYKYGIVESIDTTPDYYTVICRLYNGRYMQSEHKIIDYTIGDSVYIKVICSPERQYVRLTKIKR